MTQYKFCVENRDELANLLKLDDLNISKLNMEDNGENIEVTITSTDTIGKIRECMMAEAEDNDLMIGTLNYLSEYTGKYWYTALATEEKYEDAFEENEI